MDWIYKFRREYYVDKYMTIINYMKYHILIKKNALLCWRLLEIVYALFINGDINKFNYTVLNDRISEYMSYSKILE